MHHHLFLHGLEVPLHFGVADGFELHFVLPKPFSGSDLRVVFLLKIPEKAHFFAENAVQRNRQEAGGEDERESGELAESERFLVEARGFECRVDNGFGESRFPKIEMRKL